MELNPKYSMPISKGMHKVMLACGYTLQEQKDLSLKYVDLKVIGINRNVSFTKPHTSSKSLYIKYESIPDRGTFPCHRYEGMLHGGIKDTSLLDILQGADIINYLALPQAQRAFNQALNEILATEFTDKERAVA